MDTQVELKYRTSYRLITFSGVALLFLMGITAYIISGKDFHAVLYSSIFILLPAFFIASQGLGYLTGGPVIVITDKEIVDNRIFSREHLIPWDKIYSITAEAILYAGIYFVINTKDGKTIRFSAGAWTISAFDIAEILESYIANQPNYIITEWTALAFLH